MFRTCAKYLQQRVGANCADVELKLFHYPINQFYIIQSSIVARIASTARTVIDAGYCYTDVYNSMVCSAGHDRELCKTELEVIQRWSAICRV